MQSDSLDLGAFDTKAGAEAGIELTLVHPKSGEPTPVVIRILGADSDTWYPESGQEEYTFGDITLTELARMVPLRVITFVPPV